MHRRRAEMISLVSGDEREDRCLGDGAAGTVGPHYRWRRAVFVRVPVSAPGRGAVRHDSSSGRRVPHTNSRGPTFDQIQSGAQFDAARHMWCENGRGGCATRLSQSCRPLEQRRVLHRDVCAAHGNVRCWPCRTRPRVAHQYRARIWFSCVRRRSCRTLRSRKRSLDGTAGKFAACPIVSSSKAVAGTDAATTRSGGGTLLRTLLSVVPIQHPACDVTDHVWNRPVRAPSAYSARRPGGSP